MVHSCTLRVVSLGELRCTRSGMAPVRSTESRRRVSSGRLRSASSGRPSAASSGAAEEEEEEEVVEGSVRRESHAEEIQDRAWARADSETRGSSSESSRR